MHPVIMKLTDISTHIQFMSFILALSLFIYWQMIYGTELSIDAQVGADCCHKLWGELGPTFRHDTLRYDRTLWHELISTDLG